MDLRSVDALLTRARERAGRGDVGGARADLDRAVELQPASARVRLARAVLLVSTGAVSTYEAAAARADVERAVELGVGGGAPALAVRGWLALHVDHDPVAAEQDLSAAIEGGDRCSSTYVARGWARDALGDPAGAFADAARAAAFAPLDADARFLIGLSRIRLGDPGGADDLDRAEALYAARGDLRGRRDVWELRRAVREGRTPAPAGPGPWLWFGPSSPDRIVRVRGAPLALVAAVAVIRYLITVAVIALLTAVLPGLTAGRPVVVSLLVVSLLYRMLHTGVMSLLDSLRCLVPVPVGLVRWLHTGEVSSVAAVRWLAAGLLAAVLFDVAAWVSGWLGPGYGTGGVRPVLVVGAVLGLGTFLTGPVLRRTG
jgi:hypothetical protein